MSHILCSMFRVVMFMNCAGPPVGYAENWFLQGKRESFEPEIFA